MRKTFNALNQPVEQLDINGHTIKSKFTIRGKPYNVTYADGTKESSEYTLDGLLCRKISVDGIMTAYEHDYQGRPTKTSLYSAEGTFLYSTHTTYNAFHKLTETDAAGHRTQFIYDSAGRISEVIKNERRTCYSYDALGRIEKTKEYTSQNDFIVKIQSHDFLDRVTEERSEDSKGNVQSKVEYAYDGAGNCIKVIKYVDGGEAVTETCYDSYNRPTKITDAEGHVTHIAYKTNHVNSLGQRVLYKKTTDPLKRVKIEIFNALGHLEEEIHKDSTGKVIQEKFFYRSGSGTFAKAS